MRLFKVLHCWWRGHDYKEPVDIVTDCYRPDIKRGNVAFFKCNRCKNWEAQEWPYYPICNVCSAQPVILGGKYMGCSKCEDNKSE